MTLTSDERTERAIERLRAAADGEQPLEEWELFETLHDLALAVQETLRTVDYLKSQIEELRHEQGKPFV